MSARNRTKGAEWEREVAAYLAGGGWPDARRELERREDHGDIAGGPDGVVIECKNEAKITLSKYMAQVVAAGKRHIDRRYQGRHLIHAVIIKRRQHGTATAYAMLPLEDLAQLLREAGR